MSRAMIMFMSILICVFTSVYCIIICLVHCYLTVWTCLLHISVCPSVDINGWPNTLQIKFTKHIQSHLDMFLESHVAYPPWPNTNTHHLFFSCHFVFFFKFHLWDQIRISCVSAHLGCGPLDYYTFGMVLAYHSKRE